MSTSADWSKLKRCGHQGCDYIVGSNDHCFVHCADSTARDEFLGVIFTKEEIKILEAKWENIFYDH